MMNGFTTVRTSRCFFLIHDSITNITISALRIEWCKSRARAMRWTEEVELLQEEMRRVLQFFSWQVEWWEGQVSRLSGVTAEHEEGVIAYAMRQAHIRRSMRANCVQLWAGTRELLMTWKPFNGDHIVGTARAAPLDTTPASSTDVFS